MCHYNLYHATKHEENLIIMLKPYLLQQYNKAFWINNFCHDWNRLMDKPWSIPILVYEEQTSINLVFHFWQHS